MARKADPELKGTVQLNGLKIKKATMKMILAEKKKTGLSLTRVASRMLDKLVPDEKKASA